LLVISRFLKITANKLKGHGFGNSEIAVKLYQYITKKIMPDFINFNGFKVFLLSEDAINLALFGFENEAYEISLFKSELKMDDVVLDIGANIGLYSLIASKSIEEMGRVYSFEPDVVSFENLKQNSIRNFCKNIIPINMAVSSTNGIARLAPSSNKSSRSGYHLIKQEKNLHSVKIETVCVDDFLKNKEKKIDVIKLDCEGSEFDALKGMKNILDYNNDVKIFLEFNPSALNRLDVNIEDFLDFLFDLNFIIYNINEQKNQKEMVDKNWLLNFVEHNLNDGYTNLFCIRK